MSLRKPGTPARLSVTLTRAGKDEATPQQGCAREGAGNNHAQAAQLPAHPPATSMRATVPYSLVSGSEAQKA